MTDSAPALPEKLANIAQMFRSAPKALRLQALLEYSRKLPALPATYLEHPEFMQPVPECASPFFLVTEKEGDSVKMYFKVPEEAPTVRGYAGILTEGLQGATPEEILNVPDQFYMEMGLSELITPMRLRGMGAILHRLKNEVREKTAN
ncbi:SufE family protein [Deinococcus ruber]|uniref:Cysteine desufuration protein SufE n=1 Tax=Deinococcus ruber TaxID=1848197 RepID=A0A918FC47_9DEIO|nr:SufE family protein [Deinococcus ruber]GGR25940.1 cysteine desufuration protein SufE [Deinococcus ruber]